MDEVATKKITLSGIARWIFGLLFLLTSLGSVIGGDYLASIFLILAVIVLIPPIAQSIERKFNFSMSGVVRFLLVFGLLLGFSATVTPDTTVDNSVSDNADNSINNYADNNVDNNAESNYVNTPTEADSTEPTVYEIGDRVVVGDIAYTVTNVRTTSVVGDEFINDKADGIFVIIDMEIENLGKETTQLSSSYVKIIDSQEREFESDSSAWIHLKDNLLLKQIQPGLPSKGQAIFDVPTGTTCYLEVTDSIWESDTKLIALGNT